MCRGVDALKIHEGPRLSGKQDLLPLGYTLGEDVGEARLQS